VAEGIENPNEIIDASKHFTFLHRIASGGAGKPSGNMLEYLKIAIEDIGCDVKLKSLDGSTPLILACKNQYQGNTEAFEYLLSLDKDVNYRNKNGDSAFHTSIKHKNVELISLMMQDDEIEIKMDLADRDGKTSMTLLNECLGPEGSEVFEAAVIKKGVRQALAKMKVDIADESTKVVHIDEGQSTVIRTTSLPSAKRRLY
jgi:Ankyrin repeats (3 copies)